MTEAILNKILVTIQGKTLILYYQVKRGPERKGTGWSRYIEVLPSAELSRFNLKGLTAEMFCVNIADMVNMRGLYSGHVENERQLPVAKWQINYDEFLQLKNTVSTQLTHRQIVSLLASMPGFIRESDDQYIEFEECAVPRHTDEPKTCSGYRLTLMTEEIDDTITTLAYYYLDTHTPEGWQDIPPPAADHEAVRLALMNKLKSIRDTGINISQVRDETDYPIAKAQTSLRQVI